MFKMIDKFLFDEGYGLIYHIWEKVFGYVGIGIAILGIVEMLLNVNQELELEFWRALSVWLGGLVLCSILAIRARSRKLKELLNK